MRYANCAAEIPGNPNFVATSSIRVLSEGGAAAGLEAETSENLTYGIILQPSFGDYGRLSIAVDYFDIKIDNGVDQPGAVQHPAVVLRRSGLPRRRRLLPAGGDATPNTNALTVSNAYTNIATQIARGIDYTLRYEFDVGPGHCAHQCSATKYIEQSQKLFEDDCAG